MTIDIEKLIEEIDEDGSGQIEFDEFTALLTGGAADEGDDDEDGDGATAVGGHGWALGVFGLGGSGGAPAPPPVAGTLYEQVYLGEFLEQTLSCEVAVVPTLH